jgi:exopolysaccharide biosynthesis polyprenyl glycosylphosphotransferase
MLRPSGASTNKLALIVDNILVIVAFFVAYYGRHSLVDLDLQFDWGIPFGGEALAPLSDYYVVLFASIIVFNLSWSVLGGYIPSKMFEPSRIFRIGFFSSVLAFFAIAAALFLLKLDLSRSVVLLFCGLMAVAFVVERNLLRAFLRFYNTQRRNIRYVLIVGLGEQSLKLVQEIHRRPEIGLEVLGFGTLDKDSANQMPPIAGYKFFNNAEEIKSALKEYPIDQVIFSTIRKNLEDVEDIVIACSEQGIKTTICADLFSVGLATSEVTFFGDIPLIHYETPPGERWELTIKRGIDLVGSVILMVIFSPLFAILAIGTKLDSSGPVIFKQKRVGLNGRLFSMYKFRSMKDGAEKEQDSLQDMNEMAGPVFKIKDDPRVTPFGKFIRKFSLDEFPQLFNVFRGDMSLVGPRPPVPSEVRQYERRYRRRLSMRPGITCLWQVSGRNEIKDFDTWMRLDLQYIDTWSLLNDLRILFKTIPAVLFGHGAR